MCTCCRFCQLIENQDAYPIHLFFLATYSQKVKSKISSANIKCFLIISIAIIQAKFKKSHHISACGSSKQPKMQKDVFLKLLSCLVSNQFWLHLHMDDCHFGHITKLAKKNIAFHGGAAISSWEILLLAIDFTDVPDLQIQLCKTCKLQAASLPSASP